MRRLACLLPALCLAGCNVPETSQRMQAAEVDPELGEEPTPQAVAAESAAVPPADMVRPAPVSVKPEGPDEPPSPPVDPLSRLKRRLSEIGKERLVVVRAEVQSVLSRLGTSPPGVPWRSSESIFTDAVLDVSGVICGGLSDSAVTVTYVGGTLPDGRGRYGSFMPTDLRVGEEYALVLVETDAGTYVIEFGYTDVLRFRDSSILNIYGRGVPVAELFEVCP